jgi:hypothetical protein
LTTAISFVHLLARVNSSFRSFVSFFSITLVAFLLMCASRTPVKAAGGASSYEQRIARLEHLAEQNQAAQTGTNSGDDAWVLASAALVLMMTAPGLIPFYGRLVRSKKRAGHDDAQPGADGAGVRAVDDFRLQQRVRGR